MHQIKYGKWPRLLSWVAGELPLPSLADFPKEVVLVPIPLAKGRWLERGFNQSEVLAQELARKMGWPICNALRKIRETPAQSQLGISDRKKNLEKAFAWDVLHAVPSKVLLVDDILTSGMTLEAAAKAILRAGGKEVFGWTLFRTPLRP